MTAAIDRLNGRAPGHGKNGNPVISPWHNGKSAIIDTAYDGAPANGVAGTGVDGSTTILPISDPAAVRVLARGPDPAQPSTP